jgi:hypothetical protein
MARITGTLHKDLYIFLTASPLIPLRMRIVSKKVEKIKTRVLFSATFFPEKLAVYEII